MPQLEGQPGSRGMNPPGGISTINLSNWSDPTPSRRSSSSNNEDSSLPPSESSGSRPSAGLSDSNNSRGIARMHQQVPGGNSTISFGGQSTAAESEALLKKRPGYDEKRREMYGSGIFNETSSGSCDGSDGGFADKAPAAGENNQQQPRGRIQSDAKHKELFGSCPVDYQEPRCRPTSDAKAKELNGNNIFGYSNLDYHPPSRGSSYHENHEDGNNRFPPRPSRDSIMSPRGAGASPRSYNGEDQSDYAPFDAAGAKLCSSNVENLNDQTGRLSFSSAKARELAGDNIFGPSPLDANKLAAHNREPAGKRSQMMHNNYMHDETWDQKKHEMKSAELSSNNIFHGRGNNGGGGGSDNEPPQYQQRSVAKVREMSGSDIFSNDQPMARNTVGGIRKPPGGGSTILLA